MDVPSIKSGWYSAGPSALPGSVRCKRCNIQVPSRKTVLAGHLGSPLNGLSVLCLWCMEICQGEDHISPVTPEERGWITLYLNN